MLAVVPHAKVAWRAVGDATFLLQLESRVLYGLDDLGAEIWVVMLEEPRVEQLVNILVTARSERDVGSVRRSVMLFLKQLDELGLVTVKGELLVAENSLRGGDVEATVLWQEQLEAVAASCAHFPGQSPICSQAPQG